MKLLVIAATACLTGTAAAASTVLIDDFNVNQRVIDVPTAGQVNASQVADPGVLGGFRDTRVSTAEGEDEATEVRVRNGVLSFSNVASASGTGLITYDGDDDPTRLNTTGLGGFDLTFGGLGFGLSYDVVSADAELELTITAYDMFGGRSSSTAILPRDISNTVVTGQFSDFIGNADLTQLGSLQFEATGPDALDAQIDSISVALVPLPASVVLLGGALAMGGAFGWRKRKTNA